MEKEAKGQRIIFTGPTGTDKESVFEELIKEYSSLQGFSIQIKLVLSLDFSICLLRILYAR